MKRSVLLLDEPTNHLDFETVEALGAALRQFQGMVFFISHDRTFVNLIATQIVEVKDGKVVRYPGSYAEYVYHLEQTVRRELTADQAPRKTTAPAATEPSIYHVRKQQASQKRKLAGRIRRLEAEQAQHRQELQALEADIAAHPSAWTPERAGRFEALGRLIAEADQRWLQLQEELDALPNE